jgi:acetyl-CoA C-acetyltransferase
LFPRRAGSYYHQTKVHNTNNIHMACRVWGLSATDIMQGVVYGLRVEGEDVWDEDLCTRFDFDSCFAIPVFYQCDHFGLSVDDPRGLPLTGGLPFFGGAGNNYSAHAIAEAVQRVRGDRGSFALVGANGGWMSKYATGIYSTAPADWGANDRFAVLPKATDTVPMAKGPVASAVVETYTINRGPKGDEAIVIGRSDAGERVIANADLGDPATAAAFEGGEPFGARLALTQDDRGRTVGRVSGGRIA